jgi:hypothetical protein
MYFIDFHSFMNIGQLESQIFRNESDLEIIYFHIWLF